ncbi:hypothetical protein [Posidoniimonas corsicana]|uniref:hypothetical protein n=1 Tax=Posidoniimonas corsicana TaxID=1938618 RepID=UPI0011B4B8F1|nr:hypothetical protein [Posidoniimonas corsicana]
MAAGITLCALTLALLGAVPVASAQEESTAQPTADPGEAVELRLRVYWEAGQSGVGWSGVASLEGGVLSAPRPWGGRADSPTIAQQNGDTVVISAGSPRPSGGFDVTARGPSDAVLKIELNSPGQPPITTEVALQDVAAKPFQGTLSDAGGTLRVYRAAADVLRVRSDRPGFIFSPGEAFSFDVEAAMAGFPAHSPIDLQAELSAGRGGDAIESVVQRATADASGGCGGALSLTMPQVEGVYTVRLSARRPSGFMRGWGKGASKPLAERTFQVVVWDENRVTRLTAEGPTVVEIDPTNSRWWQRMPEWKWTRRVPWLPKGPLGSEPAEVATTESGRWVRLAGADDPNQVRWQAYPLPIDRPGEPHLLEIEAPDSSPQSLDLALFDRDAIGRAAPLGDSLSAATGGGRGKSSAEVVVIRRLFWPKTDSPMLVVSNSGQTDAMFGKVRVRSLAHEAGVATSRSERPLPACFADGQLTRLLGATQMPSSDGRYVYEDWSCFYDTATRLADYVEHAGFNGAVVTVATAEGTLYPTAVLGNQAGLDWQGVATGVVDVPRKDLIELLLREFDRRGLKLTLAMDLASAMPAVEAARRAGDASVELLDTAGLRAGEGPVQYNPLNASVRQELVRAVAELAGKCRGHESFAGVAVRLSPRCHAALPGELMGADEATVDAFLSARQLSWPAETARTPEYVRRALGGALSGPWREWRAASMASLYGEMAREVAAAEPSANLHLLIDGLLDDDSGRDALRPRLEQRISLDSLLLRRGVDRQLLATPPNLVVVSPRYADLSSQLNYAALAMQQNTLLWTDSPRAEPLEASALLHSKRLAGLPGFKARSPFGADRTFTATTLQRIAFGRQATAAAVSLLSKAPVGEVWEDATALTLSEERRTLRQLARQTPAEGDARVASASQPLAGWTLSDDKGVCLLAANPSDWPLSATFTLDAPGSSSVQRVAADAESSTPIARIDAGKHLLPLDLPAHGVAVYRFDSRDVAVTGVRLEEQTDALETLGDEVEQLGLRDLNAKSTFDGCANLSFEEVAADGLPAGWSRVSEDDQGVVSATTDGAVDGESSVSITAGPTVVRLASTPFTPPETRQLVMTFFVRAKRKSGDSSLTIRYLTGSTEDELFTTISAETLAKEDSWRQFVFAEDLPLGAATPMRIVFDAKNVEVSIDKLELHALSFPLDYELGPEARRQRLALVNVLQSAKAALADGRVTDCQDTLDGYWAQFLQRHTPLVERQAPVLAEDEKSNEEEAPRTTRGWKAYLPGFLR